MPLIISARKTEKLHTAEVGGRIRSQMYGMRTVAALAMSALSDLCFDVSDPAFEFPFVGIQITHFSG
jgi:hypothetical protein